MPPRRDCAIHFGALAVMLCAAPVARTPTRPAGSPVILLAPSARESMSAVWTRFNEHWDEQADLNTMERMLATVRPTQREFLGCLQGTVSGDTVRIESWAPAADLKQLPMAVSGDCKQVSRLLGSWHTHPYRADLQNLPVKERRLSAQDLETFAAGSDPVTLVMWDVDSMDAAAKRAGGIVHPAPVVVSYPVTDSSIHSR